MVSVGLRNPDIILMPITEEEAEELSKRFMGDEAIYVLYKLPNVEGIQIGMMSSSMREHFPMIANVWNLDEATSSALFYNGCSELEREASSITDRPVYRIRPTDDRMVAGYDVLNGTSENNLRVWLDDVVDGKYTIEPEIPSKPKAL